MSIRKKLMILAIVLGSALLINLLALIFLARTVGSGLETVEEVGIQQQVIALQMQAQIRDAEAALYRYLMEGEPGFAVQFEDQLRSFGQVVASYRSIATTGEEREWAVTLDDAYQDAAEVGAQLIQLRDQQTADLVALETQQAALSRLLAGPIRASGLAEAAYQESVSGMIGNLQEMSLAVISHLALPVETEGVRITDAMVGFRDDLQQFSTLAASENDLAWADELEASFGRIERLGSKLISGRDLQQAQFATFAAGLFYVGQEVLEGEIQPYAAANLSVARQQLMSAIDATITASIFVVITVSAIAAAVSLPLLRRIQVSMVALLQGAERVASGDLDHPVLVDGQDEFARLAEAANAMMKDLDARQRHLQARLSELEALRQVSLQLTSTLDLDTVLDTITSSAQSLLAAEGAHIFMCDDTGMNPVLAASSGLDEAKHIPPRAPRDHGLVATTARSGESQVVNSADEHPLFNTSEARAWDIEAAAAFPLKLGDRVLGVLNVALQDRRAFGEDDLRILGLLADQAALALENARLYKSLSNKENRLQEMVKTLAHVQEEERRLVGLDLHDGLIQLLLSSNMHLDTLTSMSSAFEDPAKSELSVGHTRLREAIEEARRVVLELRPTALEDFNIVEGLRHYSVEMSESEHWRLEFAAELGEAKIEPAIEAAIFRIAQEALNNIRRHAHAKRVLIELGNKGKDLILQIRDWGRGFDLDELRRDNNRIGIVGMHERAALLGGEFTVESRPGEGTKVLVRVPLLAGMAVVDSR